MHLMNCKMHEFGDFNLNSKHFYHDLRMQDSSFTGEFRNIRIRDSLKEGNLGQILNFGSKIEANQITLL